MLPPQNVLKMGHDYKAFLTSVLQLHLGQGCANRLCQSLKAQVCQLSPPLQQQLGAHRGHFLFLGWNFQIMLSLLLSFH